MDNETLAKGCFNCFVWFMIINFCIIWWGVLICLIVLLIKGITC